MKSKDLRGLIRNQAVLPQTKALGWQASVIRGLGARHNAVSVNLSIVFFVSMTQAISLAVEASPSCGSIACRLCRYREACWTGLSRVCGQCCASSFMHVVIALFR